MAGKLDNDWELAEAILKNSFKTGIDKLCSEEQLLMTGTAIDGRIQALLT